MSTRSTTDAAELVPLAERLRVMQLFRLGLGVVVVVLSEVLHVPLQVAPAVLLAGTVVYLVALVLAEVVWRVLRRRGLLLFGLMLIADGAFLAWAAYATGGAASPLRVVVLLHLVAVALLASHRTSMKLALWHSMLLFVVHYGQEAGLLRPSPPSVSGLSPMVELSLFVVLFWLVAVGTSTLSAVNERELRRRRFDLEALAAMAGEMDRAVGLDAVAGTLVSALLDAFALPRGAVLGVQEDGSVTVLARSSGTAAPLEAASVPAPDSVLTVVRDRRSSLLVGGLVPAQDRWLAQLLPGARNLVLVALHAEGRHVGVLVCEHGLRSGSRIERRVVGMIERFAAHGALALSNSLLLERLQRVADTDGLTGIANRRTFDRELPREVARATSDGRPLSLLLVDIDHFKQLNDDHGHQVGDDVLRQVAAVLAAGVREDDLVARYGGEEFVVVYRDCTGADAARRAEALRAAVQDAVTAVPVTVSGGVAELPAAAPTGQELVRLADAALYAAKRSGRNQVAAAGAEVTHVRPGAAPGGYVTAVEPVG